MNNYERVKQVCLLFTIFDVLHICVLIECSYTSVKVMVKWTFSGRREVTGFILQR